MKKHRNVKGLFSYLYNRTVIVGISILMQAAVLVLILRPGSGQYGIPPENTPVGADEILGYLDGMIAFGDGTVRSATAVPLGDATLLTLKLEDETSIEYILTHGSEEGSASLTLLGER